MSDKVKSSAENQSSNKLIALGVMIYSVVEAVIAFFVVFKPLYINTVYHNTYLDEQGVSYSVSFFGNMFQSADEFGSGTIKLSLAGAVMNILLIYVIMTVVPILLSLLFKKGYAFAKSGLIVIFGIKAVAGFMPMLVPFANVRNSIRIFGIADAVLCLCACAYFVYLNSVEYADDMLLDSEQIKAMVKRAKLGGLLLLLMAALVVCEKFAMGGYGINWSIIIGKSDQQLMQGYVLVVLFSVSLLAAIMYVRGSFASLYFFAGFGGAVALSNAYALINKVIWVNTTYKQQKALMKQGDAAATEWIGSNGMGATWWRRTAFIIVCFLIAAVVAFLAFMKIKNRVFQKAAEDEKKPALVTWICSGALVLCFFLSIVAVLQWDKKVYDSFVMGAMDYMYFIVYGGVTLFLALSMLGGCGFARWGAVGLNIVVGASNFSTIFKVFSARSSLVNANPGYHGYDYIIMGILFILSLVCCLSIIAMFVYKEIGNYMYNKSNS